MSINLDLLAKTYFYFDKPVDYNLNNKIIKIYPISVENSEIFLSSIDLLAIDKNSAPSVEIIQMSYLQFLTDILLNQNEDNIQRFVNILCLCLNIKYPKIIKDNLNKPVLIDEKNEIFINRTQFEDIRRIILYQNLIHFDDKYINPDLKKSIQEVELLKNKGIENISLERKIAIITAHCGISKKEQLLMSYRSHSFLFEEVCGEVEFTTIRPVMLFSGEGDKIEHWIYKKKKDKIQDYITQVDKYTQSMGGNQNAIKNVTGQMSNQYLNQFNNFNK